MADFNVKEIQTLKFRIQVIEQLSVAGVVLMVLGWWYSWSDSVGIIFTILIILQIIKWRFRKLLKQKEYLARIVDERTIELRVQRDQIMKESKELSDALEALAEAQDELVRSERLATVGNLTKGLLDRILNPVNYINNFADLNIDLLKQLEKNLKDKEVVMPQELYEDTTEIISMITGNLSKITEHGANTVRIVKAMEELMKDQKAHMVPADINNLCKVNLDVIAKQYQDEIAEHKIRISFERLSLSLMIDMNIEQMSKVLVNLLHNSMYAILKKAAKQNYQPEIRVKLEKQNSSVSIKVYDNGNGIEESIKGKIFEPFFTTKPTSLASGTGLYLSREIVLNHKGTVTVESEKDQFTEVTVTLPIYQNVENNGR
ncbi:MAG: HAMP domain-containing histidine kinase [Tannerellaceae bacterium]|nr:HAMP domain-containing histidine kinase [Tannerellaceae bacterium]